MTPATSASRALRQHPENHAAHAMGTAVLRRTRTGKQVHASQRPQHSCARTPFPRLNKHEKDKLQANALVAGVCKQALGIPNSAPTDTVSRKWEYTTSLPTSRFAN